MYHSFLIHSSADGHLRLLPCPGYYKQCCDEHRGAHVSFSSGFFSVYAQEWDCWDPGLEACKLPFSDSITSRMLLKSASWRHPQKLEGVRRSRPLCFWQALSHASSVMVEGACLLPRANGRNATRISRRAGSGLGWPELAVSSWGC